MAPQTPLLLVDNLLDVNSLYVAGTLVASSSLTGREPYRVIDARRERSWWQTAGAATGPTLGVDLGAGNTANPDYLFLDRGHNLAGKTVWVQYSDDGITYTTLIALVVPAAGVIGGDPTTGFTQTEEGACYALFAAAAAAHRYWLLVFHPGVSYQPVVTGAMLGKRTQLLGYSRTRDEDAGNRTEIQEMSRAGYLGTDKRYGWRTFALDLNYIGATEYDATIRTVVRDWMFTRDQPFVGIIDYGTKPERAWLYRWDGTQFSAPMTRVTRGLQIRGREVGPFLR